MKKVLAHISEANDRFAAIPVDQKERVAGLIATLRTQQQQLLNQPPTLSQSEISMQSPHIQDVNELFNELSLT